MRCARIEVSGRQTASLEGRRGETGESTAVRWLHTRDMPMSRRLSLFLLAFGVWSWVIWVTFAKNLWASGQSWTAAGSPTAYFFVHAGLSVVSFVLGTTICGV